MPPREALCHRRVRRLRRKRGRAYPAIFRATRARDVVTFRRREERRQEGDPRRGGPESVAGKWPDVA